VNGLHLSVVPEFPDMDVAQFKACVTCTATIEGDLSILINVGHLTKILFY
jgi:hypothetical protein